MSKSRSGAGVPLDKVPAAAKEICTTPLGEREVRALIRDEVRRILARGIGEETYSTRSGCGPDGYSRDAWRDLARRIGRRRGRYWYVSAEELETYEGRRGGSGERAAYFRSMETPVPAAEPWHPSMAAKAANLRAVDGGRK